MAFDAHNAAVEQAARDRERAKRAGEMERRKLQMQDDAFAIFIDLKAKAQQMLKFPLIKTQQKEGGNIIEPAKWDFDTVYRLVQAMAQIGKLAIDEGADVLINIDWTSLTDDQLQRIARGEDPLHVISAPGPGRT